MDLEQEEDEEPQVGISYTVSPLSKRALLHLSMLAQTATIPKRTPLILVVSLDISGSMGDTANIVGENGQKINNWSYLELFKHVLKTIVASLNEHDMFSLVTFSTTASVAIPMAFMTKDNVTDAHRIIEKLTPDADTNLWAGLKTGLDTLGNVDSKAVGTRVLMLLTDGQPTVSAPNGNNYEKSFKDYICACVQQRLPGIVNMFALGTNTNSELLASLSRIGGGTYSFISDTSMLASVFVKALTKYLTIGGSYVDVTIRLKDGKRFNKSALKANGITQVVLSDKDSTLSLPVSCLSYGISRNFILDLEPTNDESVKLEFSLGYVYGGIQHVSKHDMQLERDLSAENQLAIAVQRARYLFCTAIETSMGHAKMHDHISSKYVLDGAIAGLKQIVNSPVAANLKEEYVANMLPFIRDLSEELTMASSALYFDKWGKHYMCSMLEAHRTQTCTNFKDHSIERYMSDNFAAIEDMINKIYFSIKFEPRTASNHVISQQTYTNAAKSMNNSTGSCVAGKCTVLMADVSFFFVDMITIFLKKTFVFKGSLKRADKIVQGDLVATGTEHKQVGVVRCVVKSVEHMTEVMHFQDFGLEITPYHPIRTQYGAKYAFPAMINFDPQMKHSDKDLFSFLLEDGGQFMVINSYEVITLAHGILDDTVASHEFYGTQAVVEALSQFPGFDSGLVTIKASEIVRDANGLVTGFVPSLKT